MTAVTSPTPSTAVAKVAPSTRELYVQQAKERTALIATIRGTAWGATCSPEVVRAVAHYCNTNRLDAVRHVEVLGGRIYLTAEFYREMGAEILLNGTIRPDEPQLIHADARLDALATAGDEWAIAERATRVRARIQYGVDEDAPAAAVVRFRLTSGAVVVGCNWIGGSQSKKRDPVGQSEPTKTAITRAERRAWRQVIEAIPEFRDKVQAIEVAAKLATAEVAEMIADEKAATPSAHPAKLLQHGEDAYTTGATLDGVPIETAARTAEDEAFERRLAEDDAR